MKVVKLLKKKNGSITLEACIVLTLFIFFVLCLYSFFMVFEVQGKISSALFQSSQSLSIDTFNIDKIYVDFLEEEQDDLSAFAYLVDKLGMQNSVINEKNVTKNNKWYKEPATASENKELLRVVKDRFIAYLTDEGTESAADELLKKYKVEKGIKGLDFSESSVDADNNLTVKVKYKVNYVFDCPTIGIKPMEFGQSTVSRLWREKEAKYTAQKTESSEGSSGGGHGGGGGGSHG